MKSNVSRALVFLGILAVLAGVAFFAWNQFSQFHRSANSIAGGTADSSSNMLNGGIGDSSRQVSASVAMLPHGAAVTLHVRAGWHVNANPASIEYLIPTAISVEHNGKSHDVQASYPPGKNSGIRIDGKDIQVYEDRTVIPVPGLVSLKDSRVVVRVQACSSQGVCLPPANIVASAGAS